MTQYAIYFTQQWVGDHPAEWLKTRVEPSTAVVRDMEASGVGESRVLPRSIAGSPPTQAARGTPTNSRHRAPTARRVRRMAPP